MLENFVILIYIILKFMHDYILGICNAIMVLRDYIKLNYNEYDIIIIVKIGIIISQFLPAISETTCKLEDYINNVKTISVETNIETMDKSVMKVLTQAENEEIKKINKDTGIDIDDIINKTNTIQNTTGWSLLPKIKKPEKIKKHISDPSKTLSITELLFTTAVELVKKATQHQITYRI